MSKEFETTCYGMVPSGLPWHEPETDEAPEGKLLFVLGYRPGEVIEDSRYGIDRHYGGRWESHQDVLMWAYMTRAEEEAWRAEQDPLMSAIVQRAEVERAAWREEVLTNLATIKETLNRQPS